MAYRRRNYNRSRRSSSRSRRRFSFYGRRNFIRRSPRFNDSESRSFVFTQTFQVRLTNFLASFPLSGSSVPSTAYIGNAAWINLLNSAFGTETLSFGPTTAGRLFFPMAIFDSVRVKSFSVTFRPLSLPSYNADLADFTSNSPCISLYLAWDRYGTVSSFPATTNTLNSIVDDPSVKVKTWANGSEPLPLYHKVTAIPRDFRNFINVDIASNGGSVAVPYTPETSAYSPFYPNLLIALIIPTANGGDVIADFIITARANLVLQGARTPPHA